MYSQAVYAVTGGVARTMHFFPWITTAWPYLAVMLLAAGLFPSIERATKWRVFDILPPIVWTYLFVTALAVIGLWERTDEIQATQKILSAQLLPALLFLFMVGCDLRAIIALGPRVLGTFAVAMVTILLGIFVAFLIFRSVLPADGWKMMAALSATWVGGSANLVAVQQMIALPESLLPSVLLADALCYSTWIVILFSTAGFAARFDAWTGARMLSPQPLSRHAGEGLDAQRDDTAPLARAAGEGPGERATSPGILLLWLGIALSVGLASAHFAKEMPTSNMFTATSWTVLFASVAGLILARTPLARLPGYTPLASALLAVLVAVLGSQSNFDGLAEAPLFVLCGFTVLAIHIALLVGAAKLFKLDLALCGISSLAQIGGAATAPVLAATYSRVLVPVAVLLAMLGLVLGTGVAMLMAKLLSAFA